MFLSAKSELPKAWQPEHTTLYSCWMSFDAYAAALMKRVYPRMRFVARGHAFDIDVERNPMNPYLMKQTIVEVADGLYPICQLAREQMLVYLQAYANKIHVLPFGSAGQAPETILPPPFHAEGVLRIVSCAKVIPIKQVSVLLEALAAWDGCPVHWTHIGDGEGLEVLKAQAEERLDHKENVIVRWMGGMAAGDILSLYEEEPFDAFVNTSQKEGVPVSIMEAMRCGIPTIAPRVGGIPELVTEETGWLYQPDEGANGVRRCLEALACETVQQAQNRRLAARERWLEQFGNEGTLEKLFILHEGEKS